MTRVGLTALLLVFSSSLTHAGDGTQWIPTYAQILVNKQVGAQQWTVSLDLATLDLTGNVYATDGSPPAFL